MAQEDFEPKWFKHVPDPIYQLMHPAKCCWCLCVIPTGAMALTILALLSGFSALSGGAAELALADYEPQFNMTEVDMDSFQHRFRAPSNGQNDGLPAFAADVSLKLLGDSTWLATSPVRQRPAQPFPSGDDGTNKAIGRAYRARHRKSRASIYTSMLEGLLQLLGGALAFPAVFCSGTARSLRRSAELQFGTAFVMPALQFLVTVATAEAVAVAVVSAGIGAVISFIFGVHFAGVIYQYARILHVKESGAGAGDMQGAELVPPPHNGAPPPEQGRQAYSDAPPATATALRVHTSGVGPTSGL